MDYRTFDTYSKGYSHEKNNTECEDFAASYSDPEGRFYISVVCDGHSDANCFRSSKGARFGCEATIQIMRRFFELYFEDGYDKKAITIENEVRLKRSIKQCWDNKVLADIQECPLTEAEKEPLSDRVRNIYESGHGLLNIYGATLVAAGICEEAFIALHIGDGIMMCINHDGTYCEPLPGDEKSETGSPASLCDADLFSRKNAFRSLVSSDIPKAVIVSSDGIGDCMDQLDFMELFHSLIIKLQSMDAVDDEENNARESRKGYLGSCTAYYAAQGNGVEDDCSLAGIYLADASIPEVKIPLDDAVKLCSNLLKERHEFVDDYEKRKNDLISNINTQIQDSLRLAEMFFKTTKLTVIDEWIEKKKKINDLRKVLFNIDHNEKSKDSYFCKKLENYKEYIQRAGGADSADIGKVSITTVPEKYFAEDEYLKDVISSLNKYREKKENRDRIKKQDAIFGDKEETGQDEGHGFFKIFGKQIGFGLNKKTDSEDDGDIFETDSPEIEEAEKELKKAGHNLVEVFKKALSTDQAFLKS